MNVLKVLVISGIVIATTGCASFNTSSPSATPPLGASSSTKSSSSSLEELGPAVLDGVRAVGRGAVIRAQWTGTAWNVVVSDHAGATYSVEGLPSAEAAVRDVPVTAQMAAVNGRVRTVLDTAPTLDRRVDAIAAVTNGAVPSMISLEELRGVTVWKVITAEKTETYIPAS